MKKNTKKITLSAMMASLATATMLLSYFPYLTYAIPAIAGLFVMVVVIEINLKWAFGAYLASAALVFFMAEPESMLMYVCFFGYYPIIKAIIEKLRKAPVEWILKMVAFLSAVLLAYYVFSGILGINLEDINQFGKYSVMILLGFGSIVFVLYDIAVSKMSYMYFQRFHGQISKIFK